MNTPGLSYGYTRGSYWIETPSGLHQATRSGLVRQDARERFRYMLRNELGYSMTETDWIIEDIDNQPLSNRKPCWQCGSRNPCDCGPEALGKMLSF